MSHPTDEELYAWLDGETGAFARERETLAHLEQCVRCQRVLDAGRQIGDALRVWAEERAPAPAYDIAEAVVLEADARLGDALRGWAEERAPAPAYDLADAVMLGGDPVLGEALRAWAVERVPDPGDDLADWVFTTAGERTAESNAAPASVAVERAPAPVVSIESRRRPWIWAAISAGLAAAAAMLFALARPERARTTRLHEAPVARVENREAGVSVPAHSAAAPAGEEVLAAVSQGSSVLAIESEDEHTTYTVIDVPGAHEGETVAVVWVDDSGGGSSKLK